HVTMSGDTATAGGAIQVTSGTATLRGTIVAAASGGNCDGGVSSSGANLSSDGTCALAGTGDQNSTGPSLGTLGSNGGLTQTFLPANGSQAVDTAVGPGCPATDQRGLPRPSGSACDIG